jgi:hypothetical protein
MKTFYLFLADGFEEVEALTTVDLLRRAGLDIKTVSIKDGLMVTGAHGIKVESDITMSQVGEIAVEDWLMPVMCAVVIVYMYMAQIRCQHFKPLQHRNFADTSCMSHIKAKFYVRILDAIYHFADHIRAFLGKSVKPISVGMLKVGFHQSLHYFGMSA